MNILNKIENMNKNDHINNEKNEHFEQKRKKYIKKKLHTRFSEATLNS